MKASPPLSFLTLVMMISFASVNAVLFTPALPQITTFFGLTVESAQQTLTWFLIGYALGQLLYGPLSSRFGKKPALYLGVGLQIFSSFICVLSGKLQYFPLLVVGRFLLALGSGVGLKMTYTLVNECYSPAEASQKISFLTLAFAITPGLSVTLGGFLTQYYDWTSCFYAGALYGLLLLFKLSSLPETQKNLNPDALKWQHLSTAYRQQFQNTQLLAGGLLMGCATCFIYLFATLAPFIAIKLLGMNAAEYGLANILPPLGLMSGSLTSAYLAKRYPIDRTICMGIGIATLGTLVMITTLLLKLSVIFTLFLPMIVIYFGLSLIVANSSVVALSQVSDKAHGAAVMTFINMSLATVAVLSLGLLPLNTAILPSLFFFLCGGMMLTYKELSKKTERPVLA
jgi:MFS family permease